MACDTLIRGGRVVTLESVRDADLAIEDGVIVAIAPTLLSSARETIDASGMHVFPGVIDAHVHFNDPGRSEWEGFATGSAALAAGGGTCCFDMPLNASPPTLDAVSFDAKRRVAEAHSRTDFALWGGLTPDNLDHLEALAERGVIGFKAFMSSSGIDDFRHADDDTLLRGMATAARLGLPVAVHAESETITARLTAEARAAGRVGVREYLASRPIHAEVDAIRRAVAFARETGCKLHVVHVSSAAGIDEIDAARAEGIDVSAETCPHYLSLSDTDVHRLGAIAKCAPPLRPASEVDSLWRRLADRRIDLVASDHSPAPLNLKRGDDFFEVWGGIAGVQSTLPLLLDPGRAAPPNLVAQLTATNVAERFNVRRKGRIAVGFDADLAVVDLTASYTLTHAMLRDRHGLSPYVGRSFNALVKRTLVRGTTVFRDGHIVGEPRGRLVTPTREGAAHD